MVAINKKKFGTYLSNIKIEKVTGVGGLALMSAASLLAFVIPSGGDVISSLGVYLSNLGLNVFAGLLQDKYEALINEPTQSEQKRFKSLAISLTKDIKDNPILRSELGKYLESVNAFKLANEILKGNPIIQGWLLAQIFLEISNYGKEFSQIHDALEEIKGTMEYLLDNKQTYEGGYGYIKPLITPESGIEKYKSVKGNTDIDIKKYADMFSECVDSFFYIDPRWAESNRFQRDRTISYLASTPDIFFPFGYDEARMLSQSNKRAVKQLAAFMQHVEADKEVKSPPFKGAITRELILRDSSSGEWYLLYYIWGEDSGSSKPLRISFVNRYKEYREILVSEFLEKIQNINYEMGTNSENYVFPTLWIPPSLDRSNVLVSNVTSRLLKSIHLGYTNLQDLSGKQLEEIIAELLIQSGLRVSKRENQFGRTDIIAQGEFFPGIKSALAVDVTAKQRVDVADVYNTLYQYRYYPLIMVATSGDFTAGVINESYLPENSLRLILRNGNELSKWIESIKV